jgi:hypothetical protein
MKELGADTVSGQQVQKDGWRGIGSLSGELWGKEHSQESEDEWSAKSWLRVQEGLLS